MFKIHPLLPIMSVLSAGCLWCQCQCPSSAFLHHYDANQMLDCQPWQHNISAATRKNCFQPSISKHFKWECLSQSLRPIKRESQDLKAISSLSTFAVYRLPTLISCCFKSTITKQHQLIYRALSLDWSGGEHSNNNWDPENNFSLLSSKHKALDPAWPRW